MTEPTLYDNDAALKLSAYACWDTLSTSTFYPPAVLKVATFSLASQAKKAKRIVDVDRFRQQLARFLTECAVIEPSNEEIARATELEEQAAAVGQEFDTGESQLIAVLINRALPRLITGDKRALKALATLCVEEVRRRIYCLEQILRLLVEQSDWTGLRCQVCAERGADTAIAMAFGCHSHPDQAGILLGLDSYIRDAKTASGEILAD